MVVERLPEAEVGTTLTIDEILLLGSRDWTLVGRPVVKNVSVLLDVEEQTHDKKVIVFKKRRRKGYQRFNVGLLTACLFVYPSIPRLPSQTCIRDLLDTRGCVCAGGVVVQSFHRACVRDASLCWRVVKGYFVHTL